MLTDASTSRRLLRPVQCLALAVICTLWAGAGAACRKPVPKIQAALDVRPVRVLLANDVPAARIQVDGPYELHAPDGRVIASGDHLPMTELHATDGLRLGDHPIDAAEATLISPEYGAIHFAPGDEDGFLPAHQYAGDLHLAATPDGLRVINAVDIESYVAGVVPNEVWPQFHDEALKCQAVAARTYALFIMSRRAERPHDLVATEGDQVYRGLRRDALGERVRKAVNATRGLVLAWESPDGQRIFCTYYSAACGGHTQSRAHVSPGPVPDPLAGGVACDHCRIAEGNAYRWGPSEISKNDLLANLQRRLPATADWTGLAEVIVTQRSKFDRIANVEIRSPLGERVALAGERFRLAVGSRIMRSTACQLVDENDRVRFLEGRGFGHGVGLCQWGMEGQARIGRSASDILHFYYPGANIVRAY